MIDILLGLMAAGFFTITGMYLGRRRYANEIREELITISEDINTIRNTKPSEIKALSTSYVLGLRTKLYLEEND